METIGDLLERLGNVSPQRVRLRPAPGTATEQDIIEIAGRDNRPYEMVDRTLVEKAVGYRESALAVLLIELLSPFVRSRDLGIVTGEGGMMRLLLGSIRSPDVAFVSWARLPGRRMPTEPVPNIAPDLALEILSEGNTPAEMKRKRLEYFEAGTRLVWIIDPRSRTVAVYTSPTDFVVLDQSKSLDGGEVLPEFVLSLPPFFAELDRQADQQ